MSAPTPMIGFTNAASERLALFKTVTIAEAAAKHFRLELALRDAKFLCNWIAEA
jgi:hypothetical protein